ncbi:TerC family protein [Pseudochrobactrum algeriensis]|uniref:CBS domain containing-hemolysin-like protein n=2 Tax=Pseudochrobactrum TaxID=354349 RepID=A0A7W8AK44_9HYPH|nr:MULTISPECIES: TerC family protein [Pseudochrobactrum]MBX8811737.1 TerC family protein [Ochrobactrum sp. MR34]KAB0537760.1 TerC family protein [Pseudochrobactrum saccharolyticum]MBB5091848.1 CBS domain containing-hemolysin-like protein [Pseudochrobactrum saccharolyticum]QVQ35827.1 TerC family protein [Pseudochrobactrum algeriensis]QVQ39044.1 TerC family protein [Pseudochrobactrum algeriensis]
MEWIADPNAWIGLVTLIVLEIVLGIDNLVFISILAGKLPPSQRNKARLLGLALALLMRLGLLASISWIVTLTQPLFTIFSFGFSGRDIIMIVGGVFLLAKGTMELHERLEGENAVKEGNPVHAVFWQVIAQIVVLDAVFSLDSVITAVGMVQHLPVMMIAVVVAMAVMMVASKPLMTFVNKHPTVVILCLGFLMMIGFSLVIEGFGYHVPKGYLYAAIGFSILIEAANQVGRHNREKRVTTNDLRERTAGAVLRLLGGGRGSDNALSETVDVIAEHTAAADVFRPEEKEMIRGVLDLADRPVRSIMTPRNEVEWLDLDASEEELRNELRQFAHSRVILARGQVDEFVGVALTKDLLLYLADSAPIDWQSAMKQPLVVHEHSNVLRVMEQLRGSPVQMAVIVDEHGSFEGVATPTDILEAIAGEFPDEDGDAPSVETVEDGVWIVDGFTDIRRLSGILDRDLVDEDDRYTTLAGFVLWHLGHIPTGGEKFTAEGFEFEVLTMERRNIAKVKITALPAYDL